MALSSRPPFKRKKSSRNAPPADYITVDKFDEIVSREPDEMYRLLWNCLWYFAPRIEEMLSRKVEHVRDGGLAIWRSKNNTFSIIPGPPWLMEELQAYIAKNDLKEGDLLFPRKRATINYRLKKFYGFVLSGQKPVHPHAFRRGRGIYLLDHDYNTYDMQCIYGHESSETTSRYLGKEEKSVFDKLRKTYDDEERRKSV
jgi:integrase